MKLYLGPQDGRKWRLDEVDGSAFRIACSCTHATSFPPNIDISGRRYRIMGSPGNAE